MVPETDDPADDPLPNPSRVVIITGPEYIVTRQNLIAKLEAEDLVPYHRIVEIAATSLVRKFAVLFMTYSMAKRATHLFRSPKNNVTTAYGRDPMEVGVRVKLNRNNPDEFDIVFRDWIADGKTDEQGVQDSTSGNLTVTEDGREKDNGHNFDIKEDEPSHCHSGGWWRVLFSLLRGDNSTISTKVQGQKGWGCVLM